MATVVGMYLPSSFAEHDPEEIARIVDAYPLAQLVVSADGGLIATPVPMLRRVDPTSGATTFHGHLAKANPALVEGAGDRAGNARSLAGSARIPHRAAPHPTLPIFGLGTVVFRGCGMRERMIWDVLAGSRWLGVHHARSP